MDRLQPISAQRPAPSASPRIIVPVVAQRAAPRRMSIASGGSGRPVDTDAPPQQGVWRALAAVAIAPSSSADDYIPGLTIKLVSALACSVASSFRRASSKLRWRTK